MDDDVLAFGREVWGRMQGQTPGLFDKDYWQGKLLDWAMQDVDFKIDLLRFVDVLPSLSTTDQVADHVQQYLLKPGRKLPVAINAALKLAAGGLTAGLAASALRKNVGDLARRFIAGEDPAQALPNLRSLHEQGVGFTLDLLGEACLSEAEADAYAARYLAAIDLVADEVAQWPEQPRLDRNHVGPLPRGNVSIKVSAMYSQADPVDFAGSVGALKKRVLPLFLRAKERGVFVNLDLEQWQTHAMTYALLEDLLAEPELRDWPHVGIVVQAYLSRAAEHVGRLLSLARSRGAPITVRLVKGAYWDYETALALQRGWPSPVFGDKYATDAAYEALTCTLLDNIEHLWPAFGSHNLRSLSHAVVAARARKLPPEAYEIQMLHGMAEPERAAFAGLGQRVRVYAPIGELLPGMAYLVRRLLENTSNQGFLRLSHHEGVDVTELLSQPTADDSPTSTGWMPRTPMMRPGDLHSPFENCPLSDFAQEAPRVAMGCAFELVRKSLPRQVAAVVGGETSTTGERFVRRCPSDTNVDVAQVTLARLEDVDRAVEAAERAWPAWCARSLEERAQFLEALAGQLEGDRFGLAALIALEVGKPWRDADADVAEAVDFCRYYARQALTELGLRQQDELPGELNTLFYEGRGVACVIAPWNFPLAILCGMSVAALVAGNTLVMKPAEQSMAVGQALFRAMLAAGFPTDAVHFLPGVGEEVGARLVEHPQVATIAFTGSKEVGLRILRQAGQTAPTQRQVKRVICEMGGKNAIIVDDDADLDDAVAGVVKSAFGYAGQKCSACSRVLVHAELYDAFVARLVDAAGSLTVGPAHEPATKVGPVVDEHAAKRLRSWIERPAEGARLLFGGPESLEGTQALLEGHYVGPTVFEVDDPGHPLMCEELFGPVLAVFRVGSFDEALEVALKPDFALTGGVYSRAPAHLEAARRRFRVGNLYLNRPCTGALVHRQPFGGFGMSGTGTKAGGPGYLQRFADARSVTENTMRHGFTPELEG